MAKATLWVVPDAQVRKPGEQTGLDTPVVLAVNDGHLAVGLDLTAVAYALSAPPG